MPERQIDIEPNITQLSVLNEHAEIDEALAPKLNGDTLVKMFRHMLATRRLDERMINLQRQGRVGTYGPSRGQEATQVGTAMALRSDDWTAQAFREMGMTIARGWLMDLTMFFWGGYEEGNAIAPGHNDLPISVPVASQTLHGVGIAWAMKIKKTDSVCLTYLGDGGTSEGDFHEAMNFAGVFNLPVIFIVQNNHFAISHPRRKQTKSRTIAQKAIAYGFEGVQVDGNDVLAVYSATSKAVAKARAGGGPTLIECVTYRLSMHTTADDPTRYRDDKEVKEWEKRDPLIRFTKYL
ncbi:MAG: thiamine pyrophosphate-dependent dehydrogenase E1 component subunit alpha, partial [Planctomycetes bacterium]|nr:thiamine pyrophosphate-dependent dehydrogenase E1 component subunit alpha [Planctomycetota bacterium]